MELWNVIDWIIAPFPRFSTSKHKNMQETGNPSILRIGDFRWQVSRHPRGRKRQKTVPQVTKWSDHKVPKPLSCPSSHTSLALQITMELQLYAVKIVQRLFNGQSPLAKKKDVQLGSCIPPLIWTVDGESVTVWSPKCHNLPQGSRSSLSPAINPPVANHSTLIPAIFTEFPSWTMQQTILKQRDVNWNGPTC